MYAGRDMMSDVNRRHAAIQHETPPRECMCSNPVITLLDVETRPALLRRMQFQFRRLIAYVMRK